MTYDDSTHTNLTFCAVTFLTEAEKYIISLAVKIHPQFTFQNKIIEITLVFGWFHNVTVARDRS